MLYEEFRFKQLLWVGAASDKCKSHCPQHASRVNVMGFGENSTNLDDDPSVKCTIFSDVLFSI